ncbi:MAG: polyribonucleotide nucleotidyltransferase [Candidatus Omnitrophica bacterium]|nr:polyribonucleotide nucleotidyltransferase [Candidatus Omnitrophota bacterium]
MKQIVIPTGNKTIEIEINSVAKQSSGSALVKCGETIVLVTAVQSEEEKENVDFFPLICDYREQTSAAGKFPGGFFKREGKPSEREVIVSRLIDRSIRPVFPSNFQKEVQVISFVLSADTENEPDVLSAIGASVSLLVSKIPFSIPVGCVRVIKKNSEFIVNPSISDFAESNLNLVISATKDAILMLEGMGNEISEKDFLNAIEIGWNEIRKMIERIEDIVNPDKEKCEIVANEEIYNQIVEYLKLNLQNAYNYPEKQKRKEFYKQLKDSFLSKFEEEEKKKEIEKIYDIVFEKEIRNLILNSQKRLDGRTFKEIRPVECKIGLLPRTHGSALFTRGQTQCLASVTLGTSMDQQIIDGLYEETTKRFMVHYNFPPFSVGEVSPLRAPTRREIGHGYLAERSLLPLIPEEKIFPYTIRIVANILESNGSSSMATVCAGSLSLMDAGVPILKHVGGVSVGLIKEGEKYVILTDIAGEEDHYGDMDLKIAGTKDGITGFQMDVKITEINLDILEKAIFQSKEARSEILEKMYGTISSPKSNLSPYAPKFITIKINPEKVGLVIGTGGKTIKKIIEDTGVKIDILEEGEIRIYSNDLEACKKAASEINKIAEEPEIGQIYEGVVTKIFPFGAVVRFLPSQEGLIHISELAPYRVKRVEDIVKIGSPVKVKVIGFDEQGRILLSRKQALEFEKGNNKNEQTKKGG